MCIRDRKSGLGILYRKEADMADNLHRQFDHIEDFETEHPQTMNYQDYQGLNSNSTVSYTHLDVYKRQDEALPSLDSLVSLSLSLLLLVVLFENETLLSEFSGA